MRRSNSSYSPPILDCETYTTFIIDIREWRIQKIPSKKRAESPQREARARDYDYRREPQSNWKRHFRFRYSRKVSSFSRKSSQCL